MRFHQVSIIGLSLSFLTANTNGFVLPHMHERLLPLRASDIDPSPPSFEFVPTPANKEDGDEHLNANTSNGLLAGDEDSQAATVESVFGHLGRRDTMLAALVSAGFGTLSATTITSDTTTTGIPWQVAPPTPTPTTTTTMQDSVLKGDAIVRNLWLNRLAYPVLIVSLESGLFEALKNRPLSRQELGQKLTPPLAANSRALEALLAVLSSLELVHIIIINNNNNNNNNNVGGKTHERVELTQEARQVLLKDSPYFWGPQLLGADAITSTLRVALRRDHHRSATSSSYHVAAVVDYNAKSDAVIDSFIDSMQAHSSVTAMATAQTLQPIFQQAHHILDMAGGSGCFAQAIHDQTGVPVTLADLLVVVERFQSQQKHHHHAFGSGNSSNSHKIQAVAADLFDPTSWPTNADVHLLANVVHDWGPSQVLQILKGSHQALSGHNNGGKLILIEQLLHGDKSGPLPAALASVSMLLGDWRSGKQYTFGELTRFCQQAGFSRVEKGPTIGNFHTAVIAHV